MTKKRTQTSDNPTTADRLTAELSFNRARKDHEPVTDSSLTYGDLRLLARQCAVIPDAARAVEEYSCRTPVSHIATEMSALAERLRQAAAPSTGAGMVRGLEWYPDPGAFPYKTWGAQSSFGRFLIEEVSASDSPAYEVRYTPHHLIAVKDDLEEAKAAAQADYERRILAALEPVAVEPSEKHWYTRFFDADVRRMEVEREASRVKADMAELRRICTARIEELEATSIPLTKAEIQSGHNRVQWAENLIRQLPTGHNGRDSWLLNFGTKEGDGQ